jgi:hypothetical protein
MVDTLRNVSFIIMISLRLFELDQTMFYGFNCDESNASNATNCMTQISFEKMSLLSMNITSIIDMRHSIAFGNWKEICIRFLYTPPTDKVF